MNNKLLTNAAALVLFTAGAIGSGRALSDTENCNNKLLNGHYGFTLQGTKFASRTSWARHLSRWE